jgi:outer membrane protein OmpA-like peptidoglycan-associated protein
MEPNNPDSGGDGLKDGDEGHFYKTSSLKKDSDSDGLSDGDEILKNKTDPLNKDTDGGSVDDGTEVARGTNPLDASDDVKKEEIKVEAGKAIVLEGVVFDVNKSTLRPEAKRRTWFSHKREQML